MATPEARVRHRGLLPSGRTADPDTWDQGDDDGFVVRVRARPARKQRAVSLTRLMTASHSPKAKAVRRVPRVMIKSGNGTGSRRPSRTRH